jgi:DNA-binding transcriptional LysR family regulator
VDSRYLESFVTVVELGSIAAAARRLHMAPSALAQRLRALERDVGTQLIVRSGRTVKITAAGRRIMERAHGILRDVRDLKLAALDDQILKGPLRLGLIPTAMTAFAPRILREWVREHPDIEVYAKPAPSPELYEQVLSGDLDAAVLIHPLFDLPKTLSWRKLHDEALILLTPASLAAQDPLEVIAREPYIRHDHESVTGRLADDYLRRHGIRPHVRFELLTVDSVVQLVSEGLGVAIVPDALSIRTPDPTVRRWSLPEPCPHRTIGLLWLRTGARMRLVNELVTIVVGLNDDASRAPAPKASPRKRS